MGVTQSQLARLAGVSQNSVHRALHGKSGLADSTRHRILTLAAEHGYRLNASARSMRGGRQHAVALVMPSGRGVHLPLGLALSALGKCEELGLHLHLAQLPGEELADEGRVPTVLSELAVDGLLINHILDVAPNMIDLIDRYRIPSIWINSLQEQDCVRPDDYAAGRDATRLLVELGHRRIAFLHFRSPLADAHYSVGARLAGYKDVLGGEGIGPRVAEAPFSPLSLRGSQAKDDRLRVVEALLSGDARPTGVVCYEADEASIALCAAYRLGLRVPEEVSVVAFAQQTPEACGIPVTTLEVPNWTIGAIAIEALEEKIATPGQSLSPRLAAFRLLDGATCAPPG
ncbi:MAG: LacI family DNA-binding transcriptional regulator [Armatimonadia bacterium]|nr:LacI family DNA-binding transcriptional regulator [Armatimonadia bacterium]